MFAAWLTVAVGMAGMAGMANGYQPASLCQVGGMRGPAAACFSHACSMKGSSFVSSTHPRSCSLRPPSNVKRAQESAWRTVKGGGGARGLSAMFTGIVEEMGTIKEVKNGFKGWGEWEGSEGGMTLKVGGQKVLDGCYEGCSIAVNGVCLTVTEFDSSSFTVGVAPETIRKTNLGFLGQGSPVNLERAAAMDGRNSGHMVQGHVDNVGEIIDKWQDKESLFIKVKVPRELMQYIVPKGFIAIDGTSLTVCETDVANNWFTFMLIDYTQQHVIIPKKPIGDKVDQHLPSFLPASLPHLDPLPGKPGGRRDQQVCRAIVREHQREIVEIGGFSAFCLSAGVSAYTVDMGPAGCNSVGEPRADMEIDDETPSASSKHSRSHSRQHFCE
eukprot:749490-Hanusia_phi.AAC.1